MDTWPADNSTHHFVSSHTSRKGKSKVKERPWQYPVLNHGSLSSATLLEKNGSLEWITIDGRREGRQLRELHKPSTIFPATRTITNVSTRLTTRKKAEQGVHFLRSFYPDVDISFELVRDELAADEKAVAAQQSFDPYLGNTIESLRCLDGRGNHALALAFPTGEVGGSLNISPFVPKQGFLSFQPTAKPVRIFDTPIQQILSSSPATNLEPGDGVNHLAVRTYKQVTLLDLKLPWQNHFKRSGPAIKASEVFTIDPSDLNDTVVMDMAFNPFATSETIWTVNGTGSVFRSDIRDGNKVTTRIQESPSDDIASSFWRIEAGSQDNCFCLASERYVRVYDQRESHSRLSLFSLEDKKDLVTSISVPQTNHMMSLSTTSELIWLDDRNPSQAIMGWRHHRSFDRSLQVRAMNLSDATFTFLASNKTGLTSIYALSKYRGGPVFAEMGPRALPRLSHKTLPSGRTFICHSDDLFSVVELSEKGSVHNLDLNIYHPSVALDWTQNETRQRIVHEWSDEIRALDVHSSQTRPDLGKLSRRELDVVDFTQLYERLFKKPTNHGKANYSETFDGLERMPTFMRRPDAVIEHVRTTFDIAFGSGDDPIHVLRADFLTGTALHSPHGYRACKQGQIPIQDIAKKAAWHLDLSPIMRHISPDLSEIRSSSPTALLPYILESPEQERPTLAVRRENEAIDELALDLTLSADAFTSSPFICQKVHPYINQDEDDALEMSTMLSHVTQHLSLNDAEPPPVHFGHLRPISKDTHKSDDDHDPPVPETGVPVLALGIRLLLTEWEVGSDPQDYEYIDPYAMDASSRRAISTYQYHGQRRPEVQSDTQTTLPSQSQRPPLVMASASLNPPSVIKSTKTPGELADRSIQSQRPPTTQPQRLQTTRFESQPTQSIGPPGGSSQEIVTSTQVLPGPFGGRQPVGKKKGAKKRVGGF